MAIARSVQEEIKRASWIRKMFEKGLALRRAHGDDNVLDFSLGSPLLEPPGPFVDALRQLVTSPVPGMHRYMPNNGYASTREAVARGLCSQEGLTVDADDIVMTSGAAGAMNVALSSILDPGDEVIIMAPYFVEYLFYVRNHQGVARIVETTDQFAVDLAATELALNEQTKAIIINTPNNPTGRVYSQQEIDGLAVLLRAAEQRHGREIHLIADTPYRGLTYDGRSNPRLFAAHPSTMIAHSYSKELAVAGQRIGFLAINPGAPDRIALRAAATMKNRTLGFINAPALMQLALERSIDSCVAISHYQDLRDLLCDGLAAAGYELIRPQGAFYVFPRTPIPDDLAFTQALQEQRVLVVPGSGFGRPGHVRIAYCVTRESIQRAIPLFAEVYRRVQKG